MKKLTAIFLSLLMVCSLSVGILAAEDPKAIYLAAEEKTNALTSMDFDAKGKMSIVVEDGSTGASQTQTLDVTFAVDAQVNATNPENPQMNMNMEASVLNQSFQAEIYFKDQYLYYNAMGEKFKTKVDFAELYSLLDQMDQTGGLSGLMQQDFSDYYNDFAMTSNADGTRTITFSIDAQKMNGLYDQILQGMGVSMPEGVSLTYRNLSCSAVVNPEGYLSDMTMKMGIDVKDSTSSVKMDLDLSVTYHQPGQPVSVVFPDDLEEYDELIGGADTPVSPQGPLDPNPQSDYVVLGYAPVVTSVSNLS